MNVFVRLNTKGRYSEECVLGHYWLPYYFFSYYGSQWCPKTAWLQTFFKISSFVFGRTKKIIQVWNYLRESKWWQNFHFWVNYPFKHTCGFVYSFWFTCKKGSVKANRTKQTKSTLYLVRTKAFLVWIHPSILLHDSNHSSEFRHSLTSKPVTLSHV